MASPEHTMPADKLPACWADDVRMNALFAPFRLKSANPESWEMKMKFWSDMLREWCRCKADPVVSATDAKVAFVRNGRTPACLDIVVEECLRNGDVSPVSKYLQALHNGPEGWVRWGARLAFKPAAIAATAITSLLPARQTLDNDGLPKATIDPTQRLVLESAVKEQAMDLLRNFPVEAERLGTVEDLMQSCDYPKAKKESFEILLGYLVTQGLAVKKEDVVKLTETSSRVAPISESDEALHRLLAAEKKLLMDAEKFHKDANRAMDDARIAMKLGNKIAAKNHLRRKHKYTDQAAGCDSALENVRQLLHNMKQMEVNTAVVNTYKMSTEAMKKGMQEGGLTEESAHHTMDELSEVLETYDEVEKALAGSPDDADMQELEQELADLLAGPGPSGGTPSKDLKRKDPRLPSPGERVPKQTERDFVFDGEERMIAELNDLDIEDKSPEGKRSIKKEMQKMAAVAEEWNVPKRGEDVPKSSEKASKSWYPRQEEFLNNKNKNKNKNPWRADEDNNYDQSYDVLCNSFHEIRLDERLHPGQPLPPPRAAAPPVYGSQFAVQDHSLHDGVWLYNAEARSRPPPPPPSSEGLQNSTDYSSAESPGKSVTTFQMAPGMERKMSDMWPQDNNGIDDLERRLKNLREN